MFYFFNIQILLLRYYEFAIFILFFVNKRYYKYISFLYKIIELHILNRLYLHILYKYNFPSFYIF